MIKRIAFATIIYSAFMFGCAAEDNIGSEKDPIIISGDSVLVSPQIDIVKHRISDKLLGFNIIYSHYSDAFWANTPIKSELKNMGVSILRWPGGAPTNRFHWNNLNGQGWRDNWDPDYDKAYDMPESEYTDIDEYIAICRETGAEPLVGINLGSGLRYDRVDDSLEEAKNLVEYCRDNNFGVTYFYLDNEPYHTGANYKMSWSEYAEQIKLYSPLIKSICPDAKIVINWEKVRTFTLWRLIEEAGQHIDMVEIHWYWRHSEVTFDRWLSQKPMTSQTQWYEEGQSYIEEIEWFYERCRQEGFDHITLGSFEWNVGPSPTLKDYPTKYENTLMQAEMFLQFMDGGLEVANLWPIYWPKKQNDKSYNANRYLMDPTDDYSFSPSLDMFKMLSPMMGMNAHPTKATDPAIYSLSATKDNVHIIAIHSKSEKRKCIVLESAQYNEHKLTILSPDENRQTGSAQVQADTDLQYDKKREVYTFYLPPFSLATIELK